jgi:hypothetical protein
MSSEIATSGTRPNPAPVWTTLTDAPLRGLCLARESGQLLAWDESEHLYLLDAAGNRLTDRRAPARIVDAAISDTGTVIAVLLQGNHLLLLDGEMAPTADRAVLGQASRVVLDPHGRYAAVASKTGKNQFLTRFGKPAGEFETHQPLAHLQFVASQPILIGASAFGTLFAFGLEPDGGRPSLRAEELWRSQVMANVGRIEVTGDGGMVLASCFTHGVQRFDLQGRNEGAYHLGGTTSHAVPDFTGRLIAVATTEGELYLLNRTGNVRWKGGLSRGPVAVACDGLGRSVYYGLPSGEITRLDVEPSTTATASPPSRPRGGSAPKGGGVIRQAAWSIPVAESDEQAETAVLAVLDEPGRVAILTNSGRLGVFTSSGGALGQAPPIGGVGRILRTSPGWIAGATDRQIVLFDARRNQAERLDLSLVELTHLAIRPTTYGLATVQERDRIGRVSARGRWVWKRELKVGVEEIGIGPENSTAVSTDDGRLTIYDAAGEVVGMFTADPAEPLLLVPAPEDPEGAGESEVVWITLSRRAQILRGHNRLGVALWASPVPWEAWRLHAVGPRVVAEAPDGRALAFDATGHSREQGREPCQPGPIGLTPDGRLDRVIHQAEHLLGTELDGRIHWRALAAESIGPLAIGSIGTAALVGRSLAWYPAEPSPPA